MKPITPGINFTVFILFFGIAALEAFQTRNVLAVCFWVLVGLVFLVADRKVSRKETK